MSNAVEIEHVTKSFGEQVAVVRAYFGLLEAERLREVTVQTLAAQRRQLASAESRWNAGRLTRNELLVVQVAVRSSEQQLEQRDLAIARARWTLNDAIGLPVDAPTRVADVDDRLRTGGRELGTQRLEPLGAARHEDELCAFARELACQRGADP